MFWLCCLLSTVEKKNTISLCVFVLKIKKPFQNLISRDAMVTIIIEQKTQQNKSYILFLENVEARDRE